MKKNSHLCKLHHNFLEGLKKRTGGLIGTGTLNNPHPFLAELLRVSNPWAIKPTNKSLISGGFGLDWKKDKMQDLTRKLKKTLKFLKEKNYLKKV